MERKQRVQHRQRALGDPERFLGLGKRAEQSPLVHDGFGCAWSCGEILGRGLTCHHGERQRPPPKGRRWLCLHDPLPRSGKRNLLAETAPKLLTVIRGSVIL